MTAPKFTRRLVDFCCDSKLGCGHHMDGHGGYGGSCAVSGCECKVWRDHVDCDHRADPEVKFLQELLRGAVTSDQFDDYVDSWHALATRYLPGLSLHEFLGMTQEQYYEWQSPRKS